MNDREKAIVMAYTGAVMLDGDKLEIFYQYVQEKLGRCVMTHELAFPEVQDAIKDAVRDDFIELAKGNNASTVGGWISVKDRIPDEQETYLVFRKEPFGAVTTAWYSGPENGWLALDGCFYADGVVTYWMPIPEPPKEET